MCIFYNPNPRNLLLLLLLWAAPRQEIPQPIICLHPTLSSASSSHTPTNFTSSVIPSINLFNLSILDTDIFTESHPLLPPAPSPVLSSVLLILIHHSAFTAVCYTYNFTHVDMLFSTRSNLHALLCLFSALSFITGIAWRKPSPPRPLMNGLNTTLSPIHRFSQMQ